jgi:hypothetical protein
MGIDLQNVEALRTKVFVEDGRYLLFPRAHAFLKYR